MKTTPKKTRQTGFALIVTLSLMILLTVIAVGLLTLSSISLRSSSQGAAQAVANSNAKLALMLAIGDLQKHLGPDQRISADAASFKSNSPQPNVVGVWDSMGWVPDPGNGNTAPVPDYSEKAEKFRTWLVSTKTPTVPFNYVNSAPPEPIVLSNPATTGEIAPNDTRMTAGRVPLSVGTTRGGLAWMVTDNSTKAQVNIEPRLSNDIASNVANRTAGTAPAPAALSEKLKVDKPTRVISLPTYAMAVGGGDEDAMEEVTARASALTAVSNGLLTDTARGGLKTDLTTIFEGNAALSGSSGAFGQQATPYYGQNDGAPGWALLKDHYLKYHKVTNQGTGTPKFYSRSTELDPGKGGIIARPSKETLLPVIAKLQIMFSLVSHYSHDGNRVNAYNNNGVPPGNTNYAVPHLVYDPVITLYNPYDVELEMNKLRVRITDPPIAFQFRKDEENGNKSWFRNDFAAGKYHSMGSFQIANQGNPNAKKEFTFHLTYLNGGQPGGTIKLLPGETKVFSAWIKPDWNWSKETGSERTFFDWQAGDYLGVEDKRTKNTLGVEAVPGVDFRAGLQTDHLSDDGDRRPVGNRYPFEYKNGSSGDRKDHMGQGWPAIKVRDSVTVNCRPQKINQGAFDFSVDLMAGSVTIPAGTANKDPYNTNDVLRTFQFILKDPAKEMWTEPGGTGVISRTFLMEKILQKPNDPGAAGKSPFAIFTMTAKTTLDPRDDSKSWLFNNPVVEGGRHESGKIGTAAQSYDLRVQECQDFTSFPGIEVDPGIANSPNYRGFFGAKATATDGVSIVPMYRIPITPAASLGDWIGANLISSSQPPRVNYALGNSFAPPMIPSDNFIAPTSPMGSGKMLDHSYLLNSVMWDSYYFSTATEYKAQNTAFSNPRAKDTVVKDFFTSKERMLNSRLIPYISGSGDGEAVAKEYGSMTDIPFSKAFAKNAMVEGAFNVNSSSVDAWRAVLSSLREAPVTGYKNQSEDMVKRTPFVRTGLPMAGSSDLPNPANTSDVAGQIRWAGYRSLTDGQIQDLATRIVTEIRARNTEDEAPSLSLGDFINRRLGSPTSLHALKGILQTAIDKSDINKEFHDEDSLTINGSSLGEDRTKGMNNTAALDGYTADGAAPMLTQGDLLTALAPVITVRGDTFTIRSYGEARNSGGTVVLAKAWCEATVQRIPDYVDPTDKPEFDVSKGVGDVSATGLSQANVTFGRRFVVTSFRWLNSTEI